MPSNAIQTTLFFSFFLHDVAPPAALAGARGENRAGGGRRHCVTDVIATGLAEGPHLQNQCAHQLGRQVELGRHGTATEPWNRKPWDHNMNPPTHTHTRGE